MLLRIPHHWLSDLFFLFLLAILTHTVFSDLTHHLYEIDDVRYIQDATKTQDTFWHFFSPTKSLPGRPVTEFVFFLIQTYAQSDPAIYHAALILFHVLATIILLYTCRYLGYDKELCYVGALFFLLNVSHVRAVQWISCLAYPLALSGSCLAIIAFQKYTTTQKTHWYLTAILLFICAGLTHPATLVLALFFALYVPPHQIIRTTWPFFVSAVAIFTLLYTYYPHMPQAYLSDQFVLWRWFSNGLFFLGSLFTRAFWLPAQLGWQFSDFLVGLAILMMGILAIQKKWLPPKPWPLLICLFLLPFLNMPEEETYSRQLYFASAGSSILIAMFMRNGIQRLPLALWMRQSIWCVTLTICTFFSIYSIHRAEAQSLYNSGWYFLAQKEEANTPEIQNNLRQLGRSNFEQAIETDPRYTAQIALRGLYYGEIFPQFMTAQTPIHQYLKTLYQYLQTNDQHIWEQRQKLLDTHPELIPYHIQASQNLGHYFLQVGAHQNALLHLQNALPFDTANTTLHVSIGQILALQNQHAQAEEHYKKALALNPESSQAYQAYLELQLQQKRYQEAEQTAQKAIDLSPRNAHLYYHLGNALAYQNKHTLALENFEKAHRYGAHIQTMQKTLVDVLTYWGQQTHNQKQISKAYLSKALSIKPQDP